MRWVTDSACGNALNEGQPYPRGLPRDTTAQQAGQIKTAGRSTALIMARILIADDSRPIRMLLQRTLMLGGHDVLEATDGDAALASLLQERPDVAILDVIMPGQS